MTNEYEQLKEKHSEELNKFPVAFAFNDEQLKEALKKLKATKNEVCGVYGGGIIKKTNTKKWFQMFKDQHAEHKKCMENKKYVYEMFLYELANHEYCITYDLTDTLNSLNLTIKQVKKSELLTNQLIKAKEYYLKNSGEC